MLWSVTAGFTDPQGRKLWRRLPFVVPLFALLFAIFGPITGTAATVTGFTAYGILHLLAAFPLRQRKRRQAEIQCGPGYIDVKKAGTRNQRIRARDITGATTARHATGLILTLQHRQRTAPITLELESEAEVEKIRHALGIGHGGFGEIVWRTQSDHSSRMAFGTNIVSGLAGLAIALCVASGTGLGAGLAILAGFVAFFTTIMALVGTFAAPPDPSIVMTAAGLRLRTTRGWFALPYEALREVSHHPGGFHFVVPEPYHFVSVTSSGPLVGGLSEDERRVAMAQMTAASLRARGMGPHKNDVTGRVDVLRRKGESPRDWLVRLDMAGQTLAAGAGYRGNTLDAEDLWAILEDPEAEPELRAAAARVLRHVRAPETRVRIDAAVAAIRDERTNRRLRIAVSDDLDDASQSLAFLEAEERVPRAFQEPPRFVP